MGKLITLFHSKVALAILGAVLCGGSAAWIVSTPFNFSSPSSGSSAAGQFQSQAGLDGAGNNTATPGAPTPGSPTPTRTRPPTPTPGNGPVSLHGTVTGVNAVTPNTGSFTIRLRDGSSRTIVVTTQTTFQGDTTSLGGLQPGWHVDVQGVYQAGGSISATNVDASSDT